jgi:hypothetical protein
MTCAEARDLFSALLDQALTPDEHGALDLHLASCAECRTELGRFRSVVSLVRAVEPERAPVGFVDRVLARTHRAPWYRRLARSLVFPLPVKLPLGAAAAVLVGVLVSLLYRASPELDQLARRDIGPPPAVEAPAVGDAKRPQRETPERSRAEPREPVSAGKASEPTPRAETEANQPVAGLATPERDVTGRLTVSDVAAAGRALGELVSRSGGWQTGRRSIPDGREVDVAIPRAAVDEFMRELARLGPWQAGRAAGSPGDPVRARIQLVR